ncbi:MAG: PEP-CTERM sorting domain-containing protein [Pseudomonadota bacterium]
MKRYILVFLVIFFLEGALPAAATPFINIETRSINGTLTGIQIVERTRPAAGDEYTAAYTNHAGEAATTPPVRATGAGLAAIDLLAKPGTPVTVTNITEEITNPAFIASVFSPPLNIVVSEFGINPGSMLTLAGNTFALSGGFTAVQNAVNYDPASPSYGTELGYITNTNITGGGAGGTFQFDIGNVSTQTNLASVWSQVLLNGFPVDGVSTEQDFSFAGMLVLNSISTPFSGLFDGTATFFEDGSTTAQGTLNLSTSFGPASGFISASAIPQLVAVPEPGTNVLMLAGLLIIVAFGRRRNAV